MAILSPKTTRLTSIFLMYTAGPGRRAPAAWARGQPGLRNTHLSIPAAAAVVVPAVAAAHYGRFGRKLALVTVSDSPPAESASRTGRPREGVDAVAAALPTVRGRGRLRVYLKFEAAAAPRST